MIERYSINPAEAYIDIDMMSLKEYSIGEETLTVIPGFDQPMLGRQINLVLSEGLGRVITENGEHKLVEDIESLEMTSFFADMRTEHVEALNRLLEKWVTLNTPLRFLDFRTNSLLLEDGDNCIALPATENLIIP